MTANNNGLTYAEAGVDIDAGNALVERIKPAAAATKRPGVASGLGGFGGLFDLKAAGYTDPVLVAATDGVGTKLRIAIDTGNVDGVGIDLVAMCVNDLVCQGAEPLFFLDYFATGKLELDQAARIIEGIAKGCAGSGCALIGGETAEMPGMYPKGDLIWQGFLLGRWSGGRPCLRMWRRVMCCLGSPQMGCTRTVIRWCGALSTIRGCVGAMPARGPRVHWGGTADADAAVCKSGSCGDHSGRRTRLCAYHGWGPDRKPTTCFAQRPWSQG